MATCRYATIEEIELLENLIYRSLPKKADRAWSRDEHFDVTFLDYCSQTELWYAEVEFADGRLFHSTQSDLEFLASDLIRTRNVFMK